MKKTLFIISLLIVILSGCARKQSTNSCLYCGANPAYDYEIDGNTVTFCVDCYEKEMEQNRQVKQDMQGN